MPELDEFDELYKLDHCLNPLLLTGMQIHETMKRGRKKQVVGCGLIFSLCIPRELAGTYRGKRG